MTDASKITRSSLSSASPDDCSLPRRVGVESVGTAALAMAVVGSATLGLQLSPGQPGLTLLVDALTTAATLFVLIKTCESLSGAHFNPLVTAVLVLRGSLQPHQAIAYIGGQFVGALAGVGLSDAMFGVPTFVLSTMAHTGPAQWLSELVATFGLVCVVLRCGSLSGGAAAGTVACYVGSAFWFTGTGFMNPAVTVARCLTGTPAGIRAIDLPALLACEVLATAAAAWFAGRLSAAATGLQPGRTFRAERCERERRRSCRNPR
jgi:glycerol uptake facilitator-like aquaporin